jgi:hypothetical protein
MYYCYVLFVIWVSYFKAQNPSMRRVALLIMRIAQSLGAVHATSLPSSRNENCNVKTSRYDDNVASTQSGS